MDNKITASQLKGECRTVFDAKTGAMNDRLKVSKTYDEKIIDMACESWLQPEPNITFHRQFRFTVDSVAFPELTAWVVHAEYHLKSRKLVVHYYDVNVTKDGILTSPLRDYINHLLEMGSNDTITLTDYDGVGTVLGEVMFDKCFLIDHHAVHDYGTEGGNVLVHKLTFHSDYVKLS